MIQLNDILGKLNIDDRVNIRREINPEAWTMDVMLQAVAEIGKRFDPRFVLDSDNTEVYKNLVYWMMNDSRMKAVNPFTNAEMPGRLDKGIYLAGNTGSGKTVAMQIINALYYKLSPFYTPEGNLMSWKERRADYITDVYGADGDIETFKKEPLLCINDLGCEPLETMYMGSRLPVLKSIMEYRGDKKRLVTMVTSNYPICCQEMLTRYGERASSRMAEMMNYLVLKGKDRRKNF